MSIPEGFERTTASFRVIQRDGSLWVEDLHEGQGEAWLLVPEAEIGDLITALDAARKAAS